MSRNHLYTTNTKGGSRPASVIPQAGAKTLLTMLALLVIVQWSAAQTLYLESGGTWSGSGTIKVKDSVRNVSGSTATVSGTVELNASANQVIGKAGDNAITFAKLKTSGTSNKSLGVTVTVAETLAIGTGTTLVVGTNTLNIDSAAANGGTFNPSGAGIVNYRQAGGTQSVLEATYGGTLGLSGAAAKQFAGMVTTATLTHTGGGMTVNNDVSVTGAATIGTLSGVASTKTLALGTNASTIATLSGNTGTIAGGGGTLAFTNAATNGGAITGGAGAVTFSNTLATSSGTVAAGGGGMTFNGALTINSGTVTAGTGAFLTIANTVNNSGTLSLTDSGTATVSGNITNSDTLSFATGSTVTFNGASLRIPTATYGNLTIGGSGTDTAGGATTVAGNLVLNNDLRMASTGDSLIFNTASSTVSGLYEVIGKVSRTHNFLGGIAYTYNRDSVTLAFASNQNGTPVTIGMFPNTAPSAPTTNYINRKYTVYSTADLTSNAADVRLYYKDSEIVGTVNENKLAFRKYDGSTWTRYTASGYTRTISGSTNSILFASINQGFAGIQELGLFPALVQTIQSGNFADNTTWEAGALPQTDDDVLIMHTVAVTAVDTVANITVDNVSGAALNVSGANLVAAGLANYKSLSISASRTLTLSSTLTNYSGATTSVSGTGTFAAVSNAGSFSIASNGAVTSSGFTNASGASLSTASNGLLTVTSGNFRNAGAVSNDGVITVQ